MTAPPFLVMGVVNVTPDSFSDGGRISIRTRRSPTGASCAPRAPTCSTSGASRRGRAPSRSAPTRRSRARSRSCAALAADGREGLDRHDEGARRARGDRGGRALRQRRQRAALRPRARRRRRRERRRVLPHAHARRAADDAGRPALRRRRQRRQGAPGGAPARPRSQPASTSSRIHLDPGIGFGKTLEHNLELLRRLDEIVALGRPVVVGTSRKSFLGRLTGRDVGDRVAATVATNVMAFERGATIFRVHDVAPTRDALITAAATMRRWPTTTTSSPTRTKP